MQHPSKLPSFANPPVVETVLSVQFEPLPGLRTAQLGLLWSWFKSSFPVTQERPALEPVIERFPQSPVQRPQFRLQPFDTAPVPRLSFITVSGDEMIQVQSDRFIKNWQKERPDSPYPRYELTIRPKFDRDYELFLRFLSENGMGVPNLNQCEVTYVNHIVAGPGWQTYADADEVFTFLNRPSTTSPVNIEDLRTQVRFIIDQAGNPIGRLYVDIQPAFRISDDQPMYVLQLTARGQIGNGLEFLNIGRESIVRTFKALTTRNMHLVWGIHEDE
jgi:uncharacterized protein (TIGR04255 family)